MRKLQIIILLLFGNYMLTTAQGIFKIEETLQQEITQHERNEKLRINIILSEQYDQTEMRNKTQFIKNKEEKRSFIINELKKFSQVSQQNLIMFLSDMETKSAVSNIQSLWIVNMITCYASIETIETLSLHSDVLIIGWDNEQYMLPEEWEPIPTELTREIPYNITKVQANLVWALGYLGQNVIVAIIDTGVNYDHNDLAGNMWTHPNFPYYGWNFVSNNNNPMDDRGHGTHCAGTVAGQGSSGSQTGMAPNAKIMAVKVWNSKGSGTTSQMCAGIQFAAEHGAHVINMSGGVEGGGTEAERIQFRNTMVNVLNLGIISTIPAGNEGREEPPEKFRYIDPPNSIRVPGNCPPPWLHPDQTLQGGLTAVICVGATYQNDYIAAYSSRGPVTWQHITGFNDYAYNPGMGLIRPDVCAPGVGIKSLDYANNSGYTNKDGTSMAAPCVAGAIALMISAQPNLTPAEICEILETTALPLSTSKSNIYGSGRIDAYAAVCAARCYLALPIETGTINQNTVWSVPVHAVGSISIPKNVTLTVSSIVKFDSHSTFTILPGGKLILDGGTLTSACDNEMWQGITVQGDGVNHLFTTHQGSVQIIDGTIENAICGIHSTNGGMITATDANFINNTVSVKIDPVAPNLRGNSATFTHTLFTIKDNYLGNPLDFENHIMLSGCNQVNV